MQLHSTKPLLLRPIPAATVVILLGLLIAYATIALDTPTVMVRQAAVVVGLTLCVSFMLEIQLSDFRNVIRVDNAALFGLYFLTLFEFLFPQEFFDKVVTPEQVKTGLQLVFLGMTAIAIGRHLVFSRHPAKIVKALSPMSYRELFWAAVGCFVLGHLYMWIAVGFSPVDWISQMMNQRFSQDWQRGQLGGWSSFLTELHWLTYIIPAIGAHLWVQRKRVPARMLLIAVSMTVIVLFAGFSLGARYKMTFYLLSLGAGWLLSTKQIRPKRIVLIGIPAITLFIGAVFLVVNFRNMGLKTALEIATKDEHQGYAGIRENLFELRKEGGFKFIVDRNMYPISVLPSYFPAQYDFLEDEILLNILIRPVPRAMWPAKPESLSVTTESVLGVEGATIASTIVGESYVAYGISGVTIFCLGFGVMLGMWNRIPVNPENGVFVVFYSIGFVWMAVAIRSVTWVTMGFIPVLAWYFYARILLPTFTRDHQTSRQFRGIAEK